MPRKKNDSIKTLQKIEISVTEILIAENDALKPYIQTFHYEPENIALQALGSVFGIFEIDDQSEDSAYIVNFLASIIKKEYYTHPKRSSIESLEATLHKINTALSKLIKQDNTAWLGKLNATLCVFDKNQIHFSVSGKAKTLLIRDDALTDISEGLSEESELHPLKTFTEVSSGRLKENDKIILTTPGLFEVISPQDLQKNASRFTNEQFSQYIKTALINQLLFGGTIIVNVSTKTVKGTMPPKTKTVKTSSEEIPNAFSQLAFSKKPELDSFNTVDIDDEEILEQDSEYTDSKTGHIYIQGDIPETKPNEKWVHFLWRAEEISRACMTAIKKHVIRFFRQSHQHIKSQSQKTLELYQEKMAERNARHELQQETIHVAIQEENTEEASHHMDTLTETEPATTSILDYDDSEEEVSQNRSQQPFIKTFLHSLSKLLPRFQSLRDIYTKLTNRQKLMVLGALFAIFIIPYLMISAQGRGKVADTKTLETQPMVNKNPLELDRKMHTITNTQTLLSRNDLVRTTLLDGIPFAITKSSIINLEDPAKTVDFSLPAEYGNTIVQTTPMDDLNALFLLTDTGKMISFTPFNKRFSDNTIALPDTSHIADISAYLTYLYVLDSKSNAILRYPRASGGFTESTQWLKESLEIQDTDSIAINEDLYIAKGDQLLAYNRGKRDPINFEKSETPVVFSHIFANVDTQDIYTVDTVNGRLVQFGKDGLIIGQYAHESFKNAKSFTINERNKTALITTDSQAISLKLE